VKENLLLLSFLSVSYKINLKFKFLLAVKEEHKIKFHKTTHNELSHSYGTGS